MKKLRGVGVVSMTLTLACATASQPAPASSSSNEAGAETSASATPAQGPLRDCPRTNSGDGAHTYECKGYTVALIEESSALDETDLDTMVDGLSEGMQPLHEKLDAKVRVEKLDSQIGGKKVRVAKVIADHPTDNGLYFAIGYAVIVENRAIMCTAHTADGMERCGPALEYFVSGGRP